MDDAVITALVSTQLAQAHHQTLQLPFNLW